MSQATKTATIYDVVFVGAGVSTLPAATALCELGLSILIIDKGPLRRNHTIPHEICNGFGGASLFSDGKFSFYPAGTKVWELDNKASIKQGLKSTISALNAAYHATEDSIQQECKGMPLDESELLNSIDHGVPNLISVSDQWKLKPYPCVYMPLKTREKLLENYLQVLEPHILPNCIVHEVSYFVPDNNNTKIYEVHYQKNFNFQETFTVQAKNVVCAGGRFMPMFLKLPDDCKRVFKRIEMGVRIQCKAENPTWQVMQGVDPKYIHDDPQKQVQLRTFCCCREGEVVLSSYNGLHTYSGRADCDPTSLSNTGFNIRCYDESLQEEFQNLIRQMRLLKPNQQPFCFSFDEFMDPSNEKVKTTYGSFLPKLKDGIDNFFNLFPTLRDATNDVKMYGPTVEGCGVYWELDNNLKVPNHNIWIAGDSSGIFRGIVPSMLSGYYVAQEIIALTFSNQELYERVHSTIDKKLAEEMYPTTRGKLLNKIGDDVSYSHTYPYCTGKNEIAALHEIHIFLAPINPSPEIVKKYTDLCLRWNEMHPHCKPMKPCYLALEFRKKDENGNFTSEGEEVCVLQSARYVQSDDMDYIVRQCHADSEYFLANGFDVVREKIEASIYGIDGIPQTTEEMALYPTKYFEFHMRVQKREGKETDVITEEEIEQLKKISYEFGNKFGIPVPLSYNKAKHLENFHQRFLNLRFRGIGAKEAVQKVYQVRDAINVQTKFMIGKIISEYVFYDSFPNLDVGWID